MLNITDVKIRLVDNPSSRLKAVASVVIEDGLVIHDIRIVSGASDKLFIAMPSRKMPSGEFKDVVHPINSEVRNNFDSTILSAYEKALSATAAE